MMLYISWMASSEQNRGRVGLWVSGVFIGVSSVGDVDAGVEPGFFEELFKRVLEGQGLSDSTVLVFSCPQVPHLSSMTLPTISPFRVR